MTYKVWRTFQKVEKASINHLSRSSFRIITPVARSRSTPISGGIPEDLDSAVTDLLTVKMYGLKNNINRPNFVSDLSTKLSKSTSDSSFTVVVEGNIGSGKSTLLNYFNNSPSIETVGEPIEKWTNLDGHNALGLLYEDPKRWSFSFNLYALLTRVQMHTQPHTRPIKMLERSLFSTAYCFVKNSKMSHTINDYEHTILNEWFNYLVANQKANIDLIVYLRADPEVCYERLKARSRKEEAGVPMSLIQNLHDLHDDWLLRKTHPLPAPVLVLDANSNLKTMQETYDARRQEILCGLS